MFQTKLLVDKAVTDIHSYCDSECPVRMCDQCPVASALKSLTSIIFLKVE